MRPCDRREFLRWAAGVTAAAALAGGAGAAEPARRPPNVVLIYADDVGYGDLGCYGARRVKTPNLDRLAAAGLRFTDAHAPSATCTPSRYGLLTGEYPWRRPGTGILPGDAALIIEPGRPTLPAILKGAGYATGVVGKWHLGLGAGKIDWNKEIRPGPLDIGFDYAFLVPATGDRVPCVFVEDRRVVGLDPADPITVNYQRKVGDEPTGRERPDLLKVPLTHGHDNTIVNGISRIGFMAGGKAAWWKDEEIADTLTQKAIGFIERSRGTQFFLYFATHDIHVPRVPHQRFKGTSECGVRGDAIQQLDACVGEVLAALDRLKLADDTLVIFTSDNGPVINDGYADGSIKDLGDHKPAGPLRGGKYSLYEGGTRMPFIARWPGRIKPGATSDALLCQLDLMASLASLTGQPLPAGAAPDSQDVLPALVGDAPAARAHLVEHANGLAIRRGKWKLIPGGGPRRPPELYDLSADIGEATNVADRHPDVVRELSDLLDRARRGPATRPATRPAP